MTKKYSVPYVEKKTYAYYWVEDDERDEANLITINADTDPEVAVKRKIRRAYHEPVFTLLEIVEVDRAYVERLKKIWWLERRHEGDDERTDILITEPILSYLKMNVYRAFTKS